MSFRADKWRKQCLPKNSENVWPPENAEYFFLNKANAAIYRNTTLLANDFRQNQLIHTGYYYLERIQVFIFD